MAQQDARVLIVARTGPLTDGVHALLATILAVAGIAQAHDGAAVRALVREPIGVMVLDGGLPEEHVQAVLGPILRAVPQRRQVQAAAVGSNGKRRRGGGMKQDR